MNKKQLIAILAICGILAISKVFAKENSVIAPESQLKENDFNYDEYKGSLNIIKEVIGEYETSKKYDSISERNYIGIPNSLLHLEGYGLFAEREIIRLKLENAIFKGAAKEKIISLEKSLKNIEKEIDIFLKKHIWVD